MTETRLLMGMPITIRVDDTLVTHRDLNDVFSFFSEIDELCSPFKSTSDVTLFSQGKKTFSELHPTLQHILHLCEHTTQETHGYFNIYNNGSCNPSGLVKGWAIHEAAKLLEKKGFHDFFVDAGGDVQACRSNTNEPWKVGVCNPFNKKEIIKVVQLRQEGIATSGTYQRSQHIYNPLHPQSSLTDIVSMTIIGPNIYEADRFATAAFAMQNQGIQFVEHLPAFEGYMVNKEGIATQTSGFDRYVV